MNRGQRYGKVLIKKTMKSQCLKNLLLLLKVTLINSDKL